jgi:hypothetical protein
VDSTKHWQGCDCGWTSNYFNSGAHKWELNYDNDEHWFECSVCHMQGAKQAHSRRCEQRGAGHIWTCELGDCGYESPYGVEEHRYEAKDNGINNLKIEAANLWVHDVAKSCGVHYLDSASALINENRVLPDSYTNGDGLHLNGESFGLEPLLDGDAAGSDSAYGVEEGVNGWFAEENPRAVADKILLAAGDRDNLRRVGQKAGETLYVPWSVSVDRAYRRYKEILRGE